MVRRDRYELFGLRVSQQSREQYYRELNAFLSYFTENGIDGFSDLALVRGYLVEFAVEKYPTRNQCGPQMAVSAMLAVEMYFPLLRETMADFRASLER